MQVSEGGPRGIKVSVVLPESCRPSVAVAAVEEALAGYLFEVAVTVV